MTPPLSVSQVNTILRGPDLAQQARELARLLRGDTVAASLLRNNAVTISIGRAYHIVAALGALASYAEAHGPAPLPPAEPAPWDDA